VVVDASAALHSYCKVSLDEQRHRDYTMVRSAARDEIAVVEGGDFRVESAEQNCPVREKRNRQACTSHLRKDADFDPRQSDTCSDDLQLATKERSDP